jgi:hypothetical protein
MTIPTIEEYDYKGDVLDLISIFSSKLESEDVTEKTKLKDKNSKWNVVSYLQKSIRRSRPSHARRAARALAVSTEEEYLWWRMAVIAIEEVSLLEAPLIATCLYLSTNKALRHKLGAEKTAVYMAELLANAPKDRVLCHLNCAILTPEAMQRRAAFMTLPDINLVSYAYDGEASLTDRILAFKGLAGILQANPFVKRTETEWRKADRALFKTVIENTNLPPILNWIIFKGQSVGLEGMHTNIPIAWNEFKKSKLTWSMKDKMVLPNNDMVRGMLSPSFDMHTQDGKKAINYFYKSNQKINDWFTKHKLGADLLGIMIFLLEGGEVLDHFVDYDFNQHSKFLMFDQVRLRYNLELEDWFTLENIVQTELPELHKIRLKIIK